MPNLIQLVGGAWQSPLGVPVSNGIVTLELTQEGQAQGYLFENLSPYTSEEVCTGYTIEIPLDENGNIVASPAYFVYANDDLQPPNSFYKVTVYDSRGERLWGPNSQQVLSFLSPLVDTWDCGLWVPNEIEEL